MMHDYSGYNKEHGGSMFLILGCAGHSSVTPFGDRMCRSVGGANHSGTDERGGNSWERHR
ncbi:hypothetical protein Hdeb2414_s0018g00532011 [Helianthus debilis subsp. tardiflorus]